MEGIDKFKKVIFPFVEDDINMNLISQLAEELAKPIENCAQNSTVIIKNANYHEQVIPRYTNDQFREHFRMSRTAFQELINVIGAFTPEKRSKINVEKKCLFSIWVLATPESFRAASDRFGLAKSSGHNILKEFIHILVKLMSKYIVWPDPEKCARNASVFQSQSNGFPGVVGAIDGCHIFCEQPPKNANDYYNRKGFHSIILQDICDYRGRFIDCFIGLPGRMHDAAVFRNSPVYKKLIDVTTPLLPPNQHLIGDAAYPLMKNVITPFRDTGHLTSFQIRYNIKLCSLRSIIERAFGLLKGKFRRLKFLDVEDLEVANNIIGAACVLHNFILMYDGNDVECNGKLYELPEHWLNGKTWKESRKEVLLWQCYKIFISLYSGSQLLKDTCCMKL